MLSETIMSDWSLGGIYVNPVYYSIDYSVTLTYQPNGVNLDDTRFRMDIPEINFNIAQDLFLFGGGDVDLYEYVANNPVNRVDPEGLYAEEIKKSYYIDLNVSIPVWKFLGITFGVIKEGGNIYLYGGGGVVTSPSIALTASTACVTEEWNVGFQVTKLPWSGQLGYAFGKEGGLYLELGGGAGKTGFSLTGFYIYRIK